MQPRRDPIERADDGSTDLYDISTWTPRSVIDRFASGLYTGIYYGLHWIVLFAALAITLSLLATPAFLVADEPLLGAFFALSIVPALVLAGYIWYTDVTTSEPLGLLVATFILAVLFATFAAVINSLSSGAFRAIPLVGGALFFYLVVGPVEETMKLLAVRVLAYRSVSFDAVIDGAVYGAVAGLGFATIENAIYISRFLTDVDTGLFTAATGIATIRALAGPGHVIYSAIAGYYLGLAKFNPDYSGPIVVKGLLIASLIHGTYNATVQWVPWAVAGFYQPLSAEVAFVTYVVLFDLVVALYLYRKISRYRKTYRAVRVDEDRDVRSELTEFDPPQNSGG